METPKQDAILETIGSREVPVIEPTKTFRKLRTRWTKGEQDELVSFHKLGMTISQLAAHFERPESIIQEQLHKLDLI